MTTLATSGPLTTQGPADDSHFEMIDGLRVELPPMSSLASWIAAYLHGELHAFLKSHEWGRSIVETLFRLPLPKSRNRRPDVACVSFERWPKDRPVPADDAAWDVVPDVVVEVVSPNDDVDDLLEKIDEYFRADVRLVWVVHPRFALVHVYRSLGDLHALTRKDVLDGGDVLTGFRLQLAELFQDVPASAPG